MINEKESFRQIKQDKLCTQVYEQIIGLIESGYYSESNRLPPERELARLLDVSRATLREALTVLQMSGFIKTRSTQGTFIEIQQKEKPLRLSLPQLGERPFVILEARKAIEPAIAELATMVSTDESHKKIEEILDWVESDHSQYQVIGDIFSEGDRKFHFAIACSTENPVIKSVQEMIYTYTGQNLWLTLMRHSSFAEPNRWQKALEEHRKIYEAIRDRDPDLAAKRAMDHLRSVERIMIQADFSFDTLGDSSPSKI